jgi:hypothetical protein
MGQSKSGGYAKKQAVTQSQQTLLDQLLGNANPQLQSAAQGFQQFLPGGGGGEAISNAAHQRFQQQTIPSILNAFGSGSKGSSALNQALAAGAANLNTDLASQLSQMQLGAAQGLGNLGLGQAGLGVNKDQFAYMPKQQPFWQSALLALINGGSKVGAAAAGAPPGA